MCGICGELRFDGADPVRRDVVEAMREALVHRGPDDAGLFVAPDGAAGLGFRRLRIVDLSPNANQPMSTEDGAIRLVFNGEIYNFRDLRRTLEPRGHRFRSQSDAEVIVHLYEEKGLAFVDELEGMFAIAIWDGGRRQLVLARDRAGKKPLFYYRDRHRLVFASEIKALCRHPQVPIEPEPASFPQYFINGYVPCPETFYKGIAQVEPAVVLKVAADGATERREYWQLRCPTTEALAESDSPSRVDAAARVRQLLTAAVERRLISDVPLGAFLSGGIDSTIVVGLMARLTAEPVRTFSIGFEGDAAYDETRYARLVSQRFKSDHTEFRVTPSAIDLIDKLVWHYDGPCGDSSAVPTYIVSKLTAEHVTVVLTGDGGDELFAGYMRFAAALMAERVPRPIGQAVDGILARFSSPRHNRHWLARAKRYASSAALPLHERITRWNSLFYETVDGLFEPGLRATLGPIDRLGHLRRELPRMSGLTPLAQMLHANFRSYLLDDLLVKTDRCTMANSLEARSPFLDRELVEYVASLPDDLKLKGWQTKRILKEAFADLLPADIASRRKMGFGVPLDAWFRSSLSGYLKDNLLAPDAYYKTYLSASRVEALIDQHLKGHANLGQQLWSLLTFERWLRLLPGWARDRDAVAA